jgi:hypothetical protein
MGLDENIVLNILFLHIIWLDDNLDVILALGKYFVCACSSVIVDIYLSRPVQTDLHRQTCTDWPVPAVLFPAIGPGCLLMVVMSRLSCSSCPVPIVPHTSCHSLAVMF